MSFKKEKMIMKLFKIIFMSSARNLFAHKFCYLRRIFDLKNNNHNNLLCKDVIF